MRQLASRPQAGRARGVPPAKTVKPVTPAILSPVLNFKPVAAVFLHDGRSPT